MGSSAAEYLRPLKTENILHEGFLRVRADHGFVGLRPWLLRYFVICKHDHTLRRFHTADEVEAPKEKNLKVYLLKDIESVVQDVPPRFQLRLKSRSMDKEGVVVKLAADLDSEKVQWIKMLTKAIADCPQDVDEDPMRKALEAKKLAADKAAADKKRMAGGGGGGGAKKAAAPVEDDEDEDEDLAAGAAAAGAAGGADSEDEDDKPAKGKASKKTADPDEDEEDDAPKAKGKAASPASAKKAAAADVSAAAVRAFYAGGARVCTCAMRNAQASAGEHAECTTTVHARVNDTPTCSDPCLF